MHEIIDKKFYLGPIFGSLFDKKWITISELLHASGDLSRAGEDHRSSQLGVIEGEDLRMS
jgi:hypothetical protein